MSARHSREGGNPEFKIYRGKRLDPGLHRGDGVLVRL